MKNFKNTLTNKNSNSNRKPHYKAISLASLSTLALTLTLGDAGIANAMMTKGGVVKFFGSNGSRVILGVHNKTSSTTRPTSIPNVIGDIGGRFTNTGKIGTTSTTSKPNTSPVKTYKSILNIQLKGNTSGLGSGSSSQTKKPTTKPTINQNTSTLPNTSSSSTTGKKPTTTTTQLNSKININPYVTENGEPDFRPTTNNKPVVSVGTQTDPDIGGGKTNTLVSKKPTAGVGQFGDDDIDAVNKNTLTSKKPITTTNQFDDNDSINNTTLQIKNDGDGQPNNADATTLQTGTGSGNKKLTKKDKIALGVVGGLAGLGTILGLSIGLTNNGGNNSNKNNDGTPPKLVPVPESPRYSISVVNSPEGNLFTDN